MKFIKLSFDSGFFVGQLNRSISTFCDLVIEAMCKKIRCQWFAEDQSCNYLGTALVKILKNFHSIQTFHGTARMSILRKMLYHNFKITLDKSLINSSLSSITFCVEYLIPPQMKIHVSNFK